MPMIITMLVRRYCKLLHQFINQSIIDNPVNYWWPMLVGQICISRPLLHAHKHKHWRQRRTFTQKLGRKRARAECVFSRDAYNIIIIALISYNKSYKPVDYCHCQPNCGRMSGKSEFQGHSYLHITQALTSK